MSDEAEKTTRMCRGCIDDFYNPGCWSFRGAKVCLRAFIHVSKVPPWSVEPTTTLTCHRKKSHIAVKPGHPNLTKDKEHRQEYDGGSYG